METAGSTPTIDELRNERNYLRALLEHERGNFAAVEADRVARGRVIEEQGAAVAALHAEVHGRLQELTALYDARERLRVELALHAAVLDCVMGEGVAAAGGDAFLASLRAYNHQVVDELARVLPLAGRKVLDIGASPHGFALEWALRHRAAEYVGIGLDMPHELEVRAGRHAGRLLRMDAEALQLADRSFDAAVSISAFEHIARPAAALAECHRVLKPGGKCLIVFEPIWTSSGGHHLHHFGEVARLVPDWAHLTWDRDEMAAHLRPAWPGDAPLSVEEALRWIYDGRDLNRVGIVEMKRELERSPLRVESVRPLTEAPRDRARLEAAAARTGLSEQDLLTRGLSVVLAR